MAHQPHLKSLHCYDFAMETSYPSSTSLKIKTLLGAHIFRHVCCVVRALSNAKSMVMELLKKKSSNNKYNYDIKVRRKKKKKLFSSIRFHYRWSSSHVIPMPVPSKVEGLDASHVYYDSTWNTIITTEEGDDRDMEPQLSGYLHWLEDKNSENLGMDDDASEIDRLAEKFIASCHEKFRLEKQESYRRYQEMLARSM